MVIPDMLRSLAIGCLGIFLGAMLTEGLVLVPYWRSLPAAEFFAWYAANDARLLRFFGPLTAGTALAVIAAAAASFLAGRAGRWPFALAAVLLVAVVGMFPLYFQDANARFSAAAIAPGELGGELARWARWHWLRTGLAATALAAALVGTPRARG